MADVLKDLFHEKCEAQLKSIMHKESIQELVENLNDKKRTHLLLLESQKQKDSFFDVIDAENELDKAIRNELYISAIKFGFEFNEAITNNE